ncbi:E2F associated phosphoprotein [Trichuris trichiura]|uniref:E2F associated phosphoprotein n=1 Tax=Trichuris trichiura TaxID=36087 RepID=A0A077ZA85_TRITR|nr:E2F associated phosphoprotein [Trichuris trichiura]
MKRLEPIGRDAYHYGYGSDEEEAPRSSRDREENEVDYNGNYRAVSSAGAADFSEFDAEMQNELNSLYQPLESRVIRSSNASGNQADTDQNNLDLNLSDEFTLSDEEFLVEQGMKSDEPDNLLYNPTDDEDNQMWIDDHRRSYQPRNSCKRPLPKSDAVLNCPACMALLCLDCQRHVEYSSQYRAMFVENCTVKLNECLTVQPGTRKKKRRKWQRKHTNSSSAELGNPEEGLRSNVRRENADSSSDEDNERKNQFHPVFCQICGTEVAVFDCDGIYHFFNVLASYA